MAMPNSRQIEAEAAAWLARRERGAFTPADATELAAWRAASTAHEVAFIRLEAAWKEGARLKALGAGLAPGVIPAPADLRRSLSFRRRARLARPSPDSHSGTPHAQASAHESTGRRAWHGYSALAAGAVIAVVAVTWFLSPSGSAYHTAVGGLQSVPLIDGSKVTLNTDTDVRVSLSPRERRVDLERGEAFFEVAKDPARPFVVRAGSRRVVAVGTQFSVRREGDEVRVLVTEGQVRLESAGGTSDAPVTLVAAGNFARASATGTLVAPEAQAEGDAALSWRRGYLVFHETPLADAVAEFNRYNARRIVIEDPAVGSIRIGGNFRSTSSDAFVRLLADGFPIEAHERGEEILLTHR